ncbi:hypothetical protein GLOIN_2v1642036 [Rhizophagus irregularis DAOM 181602=DAOM 197198]|uniref:Uncharacterized protein n=1 Tax=Rhizophagus irregularis (strain DAOM 181602 / DAOM 197198 / MUCL 43194) TaxID=747089 RepID=A0A2P4PRI1_RHIID|nr:hypothetical protein GLOIN_2v1642036 [Rhizophagus irregularis DAOM 181602=DAOM 197198]POG67986.1 hypothetical protein GLOIN_2v1642036 [Rhizophagus irregularis DAOM 181602=DAOM 197198]|eukprot:XP_025174852.1 hypothetical protein GLOIN_2v1642036 [Rhizophagus irregularis DAOM 181602=DAOM 197198]
MKCYAFCYSHHFWEYQSVDIAWILCGYCVDIVWINLAYIKFSYFYFSNLIFLAIFSIFF